MMLGFSGSMGLQMRNRLEHEELFLCCKPKEPLLRRQTKEILIRRYLSEVVVSYVPLHGHAALHFCTLGALVCTGLPVGLPWYPESATLFHDNFYIDKCAI